MARAPFAGNHRSGRVDGHFLGEKGPFSPDATWRYCDLAARDPDRSIAARSKLLKYLSRRAHAAAFHHRELGFATREKLDQALSAISAGLDPPPRPKTAVPEEERSYARCELPCASPPGQPHPHQLILSGRYAVVAPTVHLRMLFSLEPLHLPREATDVATCGVRSE